MSKEATSAEENVVLHVYGYVWQMRLSSYEGKPGVRAKWSVRYLTGISRRVHV
jgi:hypothetical protein